MKQLSAFSIFSLFTFLLPAQTLTPRVIASGGGFVADAGFSLSYTIGEAVTATFFNTPADLILTQGFQQPEKIDTITGTFSASPDLWEIKVFPNPTGDFLQVQMISDRARSLDVSIWNIPGQLVSPRYELNAGGTTSLDVTTLPAGTYILQIKDENAQQHCIRFVKAK
ncbi:MAG: T9SS type A sorting domain-containing protein [Lewinellaceae bacterium]|nr:T9SS type A sorting domain-containing protein [Lewinellaceae bacterium]